MNLPLNLFVPNLNASKLNRFSLNPLGFFSFLSAVNLNTWWQSLAVIFLLNCLSVELPAQAWAAEAAVTSTQTNTQGGWRKWFRKNVKKEEAQAAKNTATAAASANAASSNASTTASVAGAAQASAKPPVSASPSTNPAAATPSVATPVAANNPVDKQPLLNAAGAGATTHAIAPVANLTTLSKVFSAGSAKFSVAMDDVEVLGPFPSWADAKRDYGAKGDGVTDDAPALQRAIDDLGMPGKPSVLYLPSGNYKIASTLSIKWKNGIGGYGYPGLTIVGDAPTTTKITWAGQAGKAMMNQDGSFNTRYSRITWDGKGVAKYGVTHWWNAKGGTYHDGSPEHVDEVFQDLEIGIMGGRMGANYGEMSSEGQIRRVTFIRNSYAGVNVGSWNALDWWVFDSHFVDCGRGIANTFSLGDNDAVITGAGGVYVYRSLFERSTVADFNIANTGWFSMYENVSQGSRRFFQAEGMGNNGAAIIIKGNRILDTTDPVAISNGNLGPVMLIDNKVRSKPGTTSFAVTQTDWVLNRDTLSVGNQYTVTNPISEPAGQDRIISIDDAVVAYSAIDGTLPTLPATPVRQNRKIYEVVPGSNAKQIQAVIDLVVANGDSNAVVHLPSGPFYDLDATLVVPSRTQLQIVGDSLVTTLRWKGPKNQPMIHLKGPSYATVRDLSMYSHGATAKAILIDSADQSGGRVFIEGSSPGAITAANLMNTQLTFQANTGFKGINVSNVKSLVTVGNGGIGSVSSTGNSNVLIADTWYEGVDSQLYRIDSGTFTYVGGSMAPASHQPAVQPILPAVELSNLNGKATFIGANFQLRGVPSGVGIHVGAETADSSALFLGVGGNTPKYFGRENPNGKGNIGVMLSKMPNPSGGGMSMANQGRTDDEFVRAMLAQLRALQWEKSIYTPPVGATNVHIYRIFSPHSQGVFISGY